MSIVQVDSEPLAPPPAAPQSPTTQETPLVHADFMTVTAFPAWEAFNVAFEEYQRDTYQVFVGKTSTSVATRNDRVIKQLQTKRPDLRNYESRLIPEEFKVYTRTFVCTHAGKRRSRSQGLRPRQKTRSMECPAKISVLAQRKSDDNGWHIVVRTQVTSHNHPLDAESFVMHPRNRKVQNPMVLEAVNALRKAGVKRQKIQTYIAEKEPSKHVTRSDVNNLLNRMKNDTEFLMNAFASKPPTPPISPQVRPMQTQVQPMQHPVIQLQSTQPPITQVEPTQQPTHQHTQPPVIQVQHTQPPSSQVELTQRPSNQVAYTQPRVAQVARTDTIDKDHGGNEQAPVAASSSLRGEGNGERGLPTSQPATQPTIQPTNHQSSNVMESDANSLHRLRETTHMASGVFKLRVKRLEEQNLALFKQNNKLILQNRQHVADLNQASKKSAEKDARMMALQRSHASLKATLRALTQEMSSLKEENARLLDQRQSGDLQNGAATETEDEQLETEQPAKRSLPVDTTGSDGAIEFVIRPQKRSK